MNTAVFAAMIAECTALRLAGDWRGACAAAGIDVELDPVQMSRHGQTGRTGQTGPPGLLERIEDDLRHLAPDLLRWHLPRALPAPLLAGRPVRLRDYPGTSLEVAPRYPGTDSQRLVLRAHWSGRLEDDLLASPERFDVRHTAALLDRCGGYDGHVPFFTAGCERLPRSAWGRPERIITLQEAGRWREAWHLADHRSVAIDIGRGKAVVVDGVTGEVRAARNSPDQLIPMPLIPMPHPPSELARERALHALGGAPLRGCFASHDGWRDPAVRLPRFLRLRRKHIVLLAKHGDAAALTA